MSGSIAQIERTHLGGMPVLHAPQPQGSPFLAQIVFRVGIADETLPRRGITHFVEHLALPVSSTPPVEFNAVVMGTLTHFWFSGPRDPVLRSLEDTCAALSEPPIGRLERERELLSTEAETRGPGAFGHALLLRFGASSHGLAGLVEVGLERIGPDDVRAWAAERFNVGTAALAFSGEPPVHLDLRLPAGERIEAPTPEPIRDLVTPSVFPNSYDGGVWATLVGDRSYAMTAALWTLRRRLALRLRGRRSLSYDVQVDQYPLTLRERHVFVHADCLPQNQDRVAATVVATLDELATKGPTAAELEEYVAERERDDENDAFLAEALFWHACQSAFGAPFESPAELNANARAVTPGDAAEALRSAFPTLLLGIAPSATVPGGRFTPYPVDSTYRVEGRRYRRRGLPVIKRKENERELIVGEEGITLIGEDYVRTIPFNEIAAAVHFAHDGTHLYGLDGQEIVVDAAIWRRSGELIDSVMRAIPDELVVDVREGMSIFTDPELAAGNEAFDKEDWPDAIRLLSAGLEREPLNERAWTLLAAAHAAAENQMPATEAARKAVELAPDDTFPRLLLAHLLMETGHGDEALEHARTLLELEPGDLHTLESASFLLADAGFEREAFGVAGRAVELFPNSAEAHHAHGWAAQALGAHTEARASLERAIALEPESTTHNNLGRVLLETGEYRPALAQFNRAAELDGNVYATRNTALALRLLGRHDESARAWGSWNEARLAKHQRTLDVDPLDADALWHRTQLLWNLGRDEEALVAAREAVERLPESPILRRSLTHVQLVTGNDEQAADAADRALSLDDETFDALDFAAWYGALSDHERERASTAAQEALERRPDGTRAWVAAGYGAAADGDYADAVIWFDKAIGRAPLVCCHHAGRALAHLANGDRGQAERDLRQAFALSNDRCRDALLVEARLAEKGP